MCGAQQLTERGSKTLALALIPPWFICNIEGRAGKGRVSKKIFLLYLLLLTLIIPSTTYDLGVE